MTEGDDIFENYFETVDAHRFHEFSVVSVISVARKIGD